MACKTPKGLRPFCNTSRATMMKISVFFGRFLLAMAAEYLFFTVAPWATCRPLSELAAEAVPHGEIPTYARCYYVNHGQIVFRGHPTLAEDPAQFALYAGLLLILFALFMWSGRWSRRHLYGNRTEPADPSRRPFLQTDAGRLGFRILIAAILVGLPLILAAIAPFFGEGIGVLIFAGIAVGATAITGLPSRRKKR